METSFDSGCKFLRKTFEFIYYEEEYYEEETKKHWENYFFALISLALLPVAIMLMSSYKINMDLLQERNEVTQQSTTQAVITEKDML